jgi:hypothetical protein
MLWYLSLAIVAGMGNVTVKTAEKRAAIPRIMVLKEQRGRPVAAEASV